MRIWVHKWQNLTSRKTFRTIVCIFVSVIRTNDFLVLSRLPVPLWLNVSVTGKDKKSGFLSFSKWKTDSLNTPLSRAMQTHSCWMSVNIYTTCTGEIACYCSDSHTCRDLFKHNDSSRDGQGVHLDTGYSGLQIEMDKQSTRHSVYETGIGPSSQFKFHLNGWIALMTMDARLQLLDNMHRFRWCKISNILFFVYWQWCFCFVGKLFLTLFKFPMRDIDM